MSELLPRNISSFLREVVKTFPVAVVQGARQVGKSTLATQLATGEDRVFTLDDEAVRGAIEADPVAFLTAPGSGPIVLDEVQRMPELLTAVKAEVDRRRAPGRFILTGSADLLRLEGNPESLAGRAVTVPLWNLSQGEMLGRRDDFVGALVAGAQASAPGITSQSDRFDYARRVAVGGYPEAQSLSTRMRATWVDSYLDRLLRRDAREIRSLQPERLAACLRILAANQAGELVKARIAGDAAIPATSITGYLDLLETLYLTARLRPWTPNLTQREVGRPKVVVTDSGLAARLVRATEDTLADPLQSKVFGPLLEGFVVTELMKQHSWSEQEYQLFHYRDSADGTEVDVVIELADGRVWGIEVKASSTHRPEHVRGLLRLRDRLGSRFAGGVVLTTATRGFAHAQGITAHPISALWDLA